MQKILLLTCAVILFSGCAPIGITPNEGLMSDYAYVVGQKASTNGNTFRFNHVDHESIFYLRDAPDDNSYSVQKVKPGRYIFQYIVHPRGYNMSMSELGTVQLEQGKINYIGTINVEHSQVVETWSTISSRVTPKVTYQPEVVKEIIRKQYPGLAPDLDDTFTVQPLR